ncbi:hypothetical protein [Pseudonocardia sp. GCM10023141]|uniref:hypothetical protein n=1 Tax=Pseudonocardia sp. GCM10023141 TaxID=3252653 RepID=UPI00360B1CC3
MPTLPWTTVDQPEPGTDAVVMASRFRVRGFRHVLPFFIAAMRVHAQVRRAEGALGVSLVAHPLRREFRTLSAWRDRDALNAMVRTEPHRSVMVAQKEVMADSVFRFWTVPVAELPLSWVDAEQRLEARG